MPRRITKLSAGAEGLLAALGVATTSAKATTSAFAALDLAVREAGTRRVEAVNALFHRSLIGHELAKRAAFGLPCGAVYRVRTKVAGLPVPPARVKVA